MFQRRKLVLQENFHISSSLRDFARAFLLEHCACAHCSYLVLKHGWYEWDINFHGTNAKARCWLEVSENPLEENKYVGQDKDVERERSCSPFGGCSADEFQSTC